MTERKPHDRDVARLCRVCERVLWSMEVLVNRSKEYPGRDIQDAKRHLTRAKEDVERVLERLHNCNL